MTEHTAAANRILLITVLNSALHTLVYTNNLCVTDEPELLPKEHQCFKIDNTESIRLVRDGLALLCHNENQPS